MATYHQVQFAPQLKELESCINILQSAKATGEQNDAAAAAAAKSRALALLADVVPYMSIFDVSIDIFALTIRLDDIDLVRAIFEHWPPHRDKYILLDYPLTWNEESLRALELAIVLNSYNSIKYILSLGLIDLNKKINSFFFNQDCPLFFAAYRGDATSCALLIDAGAQIVMSNGRGDMTPLHVAVVQGKWDIVELLVLQRGGADWRSVWEKTKMEQCQYGECKVSNRLEFGTFLVKHKLLSVDELFEEQSWLIAKVKQLEQEAFEKGQALKKEQSRHSFVSLSKSSKEQLEDFLAYYPLFDKTFELSQYENSKELDPRGHVHLVKTNTLGSGGVLLSKQVVFKKLLYTPVLDKIVRNEIAIMVKLQQLNHPHLLHLDKLFIEGPYVYLQLPHCQAGYVGNTLYNTRYQHLRLLHLYQLLLAVGHLHENGVYHRDIKPSNVLLRIEVNAPKYPMVKLADFGLSKDISEDQVVSITATDDVHKVGTYRYMSPEMRAGHIDSKLFPGASDMWSVGVLAAELLFTQASARRDAPNSFAEILGVRELADATLFSEIASKETKQNALDLISKMLIHEPQQRITAADALEHPLFASIRIEYQELLAKLLESDRSEQLADATSEQHFASFMSDEYQDMIIKGFGGF